MKLLLAHRDVEVNSRSGRGRTPLSYAAEGAHSEVVELLLAYDSDVEINSQDIYSQTPLSYATEGGHLAVMKLLRAHGGRGVNSED